jgi:hypothetical protein
MRYWLPTCRFAAPLLGLVFPLVLALPLQAQPYPYRPAPWNQAPVPYQGPVLPQPPMPPLAFTPLADPPTAPLPATPPGQAQTPQTPQVPTSPQAPQANQAPAQTNEENAPETSPGNEQASAGEAGTFAAPNMVGHLLFGSRSIQFSYNRAGGAINVVNPGSTSFTNPAVADCESPLPEDRASFRFNYYGNAQQVTGFGPPVFAPNGVGTSFAQTKQYDAEEYTFYLEKTFLDGRASLELRVPFSTGLSNNLNLSAGNAGGFTGAQTLTGPAFNVATTPENSLGSNGTQFGDMTLILKALAYTSKTLALTGGLALGLPTGDNNSVNINDFSGGIGQGTATIQRERLIHVNNETWSLSPFLAYLHTPNDRLFTQGFVQFDFPLNDSNINYTEYYARGMAHPLPPGAVLYPTLNPPFTYGTGVSEQALAQLDWGIGYWVVRDPSRRWITGIAPDLELHYTGTLTPSHVATLPADNLAVLAPNHTLVQGSPPRVGDPYTNTDILDMTAAVTFLLADRATVATAVAFPLLGGHDRTFEWEYQLQLTYYFGGVGQRFAPNF